MHNEVSLCSLQVSGRVGNYTLFMSVLFFYGHIVTIYDWLLFVSRLHFSSLALHDVDRCDVFTFAIVRCVEHH